MFRSLKCVVGFEALLMFAKHFFGMTTTDLKAHIAMKQQILKVKIII